MLQVQQKTTGLELSSLILLVQRVTQYATTATYPTPLLLYIINVILYVTCMCIVLIKKLHPWPDEKTSAELNPNPNTNARFAC